MNSLFDHGLRVLVAVATMAGFVYVIGDVLRLDTTGHLALLSLVTLYLIALHQLDMARTLGEVRSHVAEPAEENDYQGREPI